MLNIIRLTFAIFVIVLIVPQTPTENLVLRIFYETRSFTNYGQANKFLNLVTWACICLFLLMTFIGIS